MARTSARYACDHIGRSHAVRSDRSCCILYQPAGEKTRARARTLNSFCQEVTIYTVTELTLTDSTVRTLLSTLVPFSFLFFFFFLYDAITLQRVVRVRT